jgi:hypothetical protein
MSFPFPVNGAGAVPDGTPPQPAAPTPGLGGRADYGAQQAPVAEQAHAGFDPPAITNRTNFASWDHGALKSAADTLNSGSMTALASAWIDRGQYIGGDMRGVGLAINQATRGRWLGNGHKAATAASTAYAARGDELGAAMMVTGSKLSEAADAASAAKAAVPPPIPVDPTHALIVGSMNPQNPLAGQMDLEAQQRVAEEARLKAVDAMERVYAAGYVESDAGVPVLPPPIAPTSGAGPGSGSGGGPGTGDPGSGGPGSGPGTGGDGNGRGTGTGTGSYAPPPAQTRSEAFAAAAPANHTVPAPAGQFGASGGGHLSADGPSGGSGHPGGAGQPAGVGQPGVGQPGVGQPGVGQPGGWWPWQRRHWSW